jgi:hypothetical protein
MLAQQGHPIDDNLANVFADWKEPSREGLCPLRPDRARVLFDQFVLDVDVF